HKVMKDYLSATQEYLVIADKNDITQTIRKDFLHIFEKAVHITATDLSDTFVIRNIATFFEDIKATVSKGDYDFSDYEKKMVKDFKPHPLVTPKADTLARSEELFRALYVITMIKIEILYYKFFERELTTKEGSKTK